MRSLTNIVLGGLLLVLACIVPAQAGTRSSASYSITAESMDAGGSASTSGSYTHAGSVSGLSAGISTTAAQAAFKQGYLGQLFEVSGLTLASASTNIDEGASQALSVVALLDDGTWLSSGSFSVVWSVLDGPIVSVSADGLATASRVYQNTPATVQAQYSGVAGSLGLAIINVNNDDFGSYAGDGIDDAWQVRYFGLNNPDAAPGVDADGSHLGNRFKYIAGLDPTDPSSVFSLKIVSTNGLPALVFSPRFVDRTYTVLYRTDLTSGSFTPLTTSTVSDDGTVRTITDTNTTDGIRFYRVQISLP